MQARPYKTVAPKETVTTIKKILNSYNIEVIEKRWYNPHPNVFSVLLETNSTLGQFSTSGKGVTRDLALASAYAEFLERLQNGLISQTPFSRANLNRIKTKTGFYYFRDETVSSKIDFNRIPSSIKADLFGDEFPNNAVERYFNRLKENGLDGVTSLPFKELSTGKVINLPYNLLIGLTGSNGMCAGNSPSEAIYQGLCELIERYAASYIFFNQICPPSIPNDVLSAFPEAANIIDDIERNSTFKVDVKSFETPFGLPVLGVIISDRTNNLYRLNVGCDKSFSVALRRCLTEIYQGVEDNEAMHSIMLPMPSRKASWFRDNDEYSVQRRRKEFVKFCVNGQGVFPSSLFAGKSQYSFSMDSFGELESFEAEVDDLVQKIQKMGTTVYMHDSSYMNFPAFWLYIPGFLLASAEGNNMYPINDIDRAISFDQIEDVLFSNLESLNSRTQLANLLEPIPKDETLHSITRIETFNGVWEKLPLAYLLTLLWNSIGNFPKALDNLAELKRQYPNASKYDFLDNLIGIDSKVNDSLNYIRLPRCPDCINCSLENDCKVSGKIRLYERSTGSHFFHQ